ncbi:MAG: GNAT family N-acetyltransferase [Blastocatellia bacterium]|nr:GNAT family N-acetyltransferase [Blastocatellia bacterium]
MPESKPITQTTPPAVTLRRAALSDVPELAQLGSQLFRQHYAYDAQRFFIAEPLVNHHAQFFAEQLRNEAAIILVAEIENRLVGYAFVRLEAESFVDASAACAWLHDIYVDAGARGDKLGKRLMQAAIEAAHELGSSCLMLSVSPHNAVAQTFFRQQGFRPTMVEMRLDFASPDNP